MGGARDRIGRRHGAVDRNPRGLAQFGQERGLDGLLARRQHQRQFRAGQHVGARRPDAARDRDDPGQAGAERQAVEVEIGGVAVLVAVPEYPEHDAAPDLGMARSVEEGAPLQGLAVEGDGERVVARRPGKRRLDRLQGLRGRERDRRSVRPGRAVVGDGGRLLLAEELRRR